MINVSLEFKNVMNDGSTPFLAGAEITLKDGTVFTLDNDDIRILEIEDATSQQGQFSIGSAIVNELTLAFNNLNDEYSDYDFTDAIIRPTVGLKLSASTETLNKGVFTADDPKAQSSVITLTALDNMIKFDKSFKGVTLVFPCTAGDLLQTVCTYCGVILGTSTFTNSTFTIQSRPLDDAITCRDVLIYIAQIAGCFARINTSGQLELKWYDFGVFGEEAHLDGGKFDDSTPYSSGDSKDGGTFAYTGSDEVDGGGFTIPNRYHHVYSMPTVPSIATDDVVITGIQVSDVAETPNTVLYGQAGYIISIEKNPLIQSLTDVQTISNSVGLKIVGMRFRPMTLSTRSNPTIEAGDVGYVSTRKGVYQTLFTNVIFGAGQATKLTCDAQSPIRNSAVRFSAATKTIVEARKMVNTEKSAREQAISNLAEELANASGLYMTKEQQPDLSYIYYMHDKPTLAESMVIWKLTANAFGISTDGGATYPYGLDVNGDAILNRIYAIGIDATYITTGLLKSTDGKTIIDMEKGVVNSDNISFSDNVQDGFPLKMPFNIDDSVSQINKVLLKWTVDKFRTSSTTASSGGGSTITSEGGGGTTVTSSGEKQPGVGITSEGGSVASSSDNSEYNGVYQSETGSADGTVGAHKHSIFITSHVHRVYFPAIPSHTHEYYMLSHSHDVVIPSHTHGVTIPSHTHALNFGIQETPVTSNAIDIYIDNTLRKSVNLAQGIEDLTQWITTTGWHTIELRSTTLKRISAQVVIKSYIRS